MKKQRRLLAILVGRQVRKFDPPELPKILKEPTEEEIKLYKRGNKNIDNSKYLLCQCWCGNYYISLKSNVAKSLSLTCGKHSNDKRQINEVGHHYGELIVLNKSSYKKYDRISWNCLCSCGAQIIATGKELRSGEVRSCGCVKSKGERLITQTLINMRANFIKEYKFADFMTNKHRNYRFDWAVFDKNNSLLCVIEYDGEQHFDKTNKWHRSDDSDSIKDEYCKQNKIKLIRIPFYDYDKINEKYLEDLIYET